MEMDVRDVAFTKYRRIDPSDRGAPCQPFSTAGKQRLGEDPRNMFPEVLSAIHRSRPRALLLENVPGMLMGEAREYFDEVVTHIDKLGYETSWNLGNCADYGVGAGLRRGLPP